MPLRIRVLEVPGEPLRGHTGDHLLVTDGHVSAAVELLLRAAPDAALLGDRVHAPAVARVVFPLQHAGGARHALWEAELEADVLHGAVVAVRHHVAGAAVAVQLQQVSVQALLGDVGEGAVVLAQPELEIALQIEIRSTFI